MSEDSLYVCDTLWAKFNIKSSDWIKYLDWDWIMWISLYSLYGYCKIKKISHQGNLSFDIYV